MAAVSEKNQTVAVAARSLERAEEMAKRFHIPRAYGSYDELAADSEIDVVYVGTIHPEHKAAVSLFLNAGKHVLCEKPITMRLKDAEELVALAREKKRFLMEGFWSRFFPVYARLRELADAGAVGPLRSVEASFEVPIGHVPRIKEKALGGSALLDIGCYCLQFAQWIFREKHERIEITGELFDTGVDKSGKIEMVYSGGRRALLSFNGDHNGSTAAAVVGEKGRIEVPRFFWSATELVLPDGETERHPLPTGAQHDFNFANSQGFAYEIDHVRECIEKGLLESPLMPLDETLHMMSIHEHCLSKLGVSFD